MASAHPIVPTPSLVVDLDVLERNVAELAARARDLRIVVRPHAKTHKCPEIADLQRAAGAVGLTVATVSEAEVFADSGHDDLFIAYPLWVDAAKGARLRRLAERTTLTVGTDSPEAVRALAAQLGDLRERVGVLVEVDSGHHRSGVDPEGAGPLADVARHCGLRIDGVFTFPGHGYAPGARDRAAVAEADALTRASAALVRAGLEPRVVSGGSTPTVSAISPGAMTEMRPGVYVFGDAQQWELGAASPDHIALTCLATVVSHTGGRVVIDAGSKAIGADRLPWAAGHARLLDHPDATVVGLSEHHAVIEWDRDVLPELGTTLRVVPNHVCAAVNLADELVLSRAGTITGTWRVAARGANT